MSVQHLVLLQFILSLLWWPLSNTLAIVSEPTSLAKKGCQQYCGKITNIPYPFGIGRVGNNSSCYLDEEYEIDCRDNDKPTARPFLKKLDLEVLNISIAAIDNNIGYSIGDWIKVNSPVVRSPNCNGSSSSVGAVRRGLNLTGTVFTFSSYANSFAAAGCNSSVWISNGEQTAGCIPSCSGTCCNTTFSSDPQVLSVNFNSSEQKCQYAFIVEDTWLQTHQHKRSCLSIVQHLDYAPAVLKWGIGRSSAEGHRLSNESLMLRNSSINCYEDGASSFLSCTCSYGFGGNPYLPDGCGDVNECEDPVKYGAVCSQYLQTCTNTRGGFRCDVLRIKIIIIVIGSSLALLILIIVAWWLYKVFKRMQKIKLKMEFFKRNGGLLLEQQISTSQGSVETAKIFTSKELEKATENFNVNRILGQGGQGTVYKGMLSDGRIVAVKKSKVEDKGLEEFINEVVILSQVNHRNVVKLLGCCLETEVPLLVYEFIPNGNLFQYLHNQDEEFPISWQMRLQIATEVAGAVSYLHSSASIPIYHRDIKSANILLDGKYRAKVADFGTSRSISLDQTHLTTLVHGTFGYLDPEYFQSSQFTDKSDVYSFGVVLAELLTGQTPISSLRSEEGRGLATYFLMSMKENLLFDILDPQVKQQGSKDDVVAVANLAKRCLNLKGRNRPTMREVAVELEMIRSWSINAVNWNANHEEIEFVESQESEPWDDASASTGSAMEVQLASSADVQPLLPSRSW